MAAGSEPPNIRHILDRLRPLCTGLSLCGAGAGGFAAVILKREFTLSDLQRCVEGINAGLLLGEGVANQGELLSMHTAEIDWDGLQCTVYGYILSSGDGHVLAQLEEILR